MARAERRQKDEAMAAYMKDHPHSFPDSVMRPWNGVGSDVRAEALKMGRIPHNGTKFMTGMLGGVLAHRMGFHCPATEAYV